MINPEIKTGLMRQGQQNRRGRNRGGGGNGGGNGGSSHNGGSNNGGGGRKPQNSLSRSYESSGPDVKIRGTAMHIAEKYTSLARDATAAGDMIGAENYLQHAEHYIRIIMAAQALNVSHQGTDNPNGMNGNGRFHPQEPFHTNFDQDITDEGDSVDGPPMRPMYQERQNSYHQHNQPQPYISQPAFPVSQVRQPLAQPLQAPTVSPPVPASSEEQPEGPPVEMADPERIVRRPRRRAPLAGRERRPFNGPAGSDAPLNGPDPGQADGNSNGDQS